MFYCRCTPSAFCWSPACFLTLNCDVIKIRLRDHVAISDVLCLRLSTWILSWQKSIDAALALRKCPCFASSVSGVCGLPWIHYIVLTVGSVARSIAPGRSSVVRCCVLRRHPA